MSVVTHASAATFISANSGLPIARIIHKATGAGACELWEQPLQPGDVIPMHYHLVEELITVQSGRVKVILDGEEHVIDADTDGTSSVLIGARVHHQISNIGSRPTFMFAYFPAVEPEIFPVR